MRSHWCQPAPAVHDLYHLADSMIRSAEQTHDSELPLVDNAGTEEATQSAAGRLVGLSWVMGAMMHEVKIVFAPCLSSRYSTSDSFPTFRLLLGSSDRALVFLFSGIHLLKLRNRFGVHRKCVHPRIRRCAPQLLIAVVSFQLGTLRWNQVFSACSFELLICYYCYCTCIIHSDNKCGRVQMNGTLPKVLHHFGLGPEPACLLQCNRKSPVTGYHPLLIHSTPINAIAVQRV